METVHGMQLIYTRVQRDFSPVHIGGFQTYYHSQELSEEEVSQIETCVKGFVTTDSGLVRRQFFSLETGKIVLTYSKGIVSHPEIIDKYAREGLFLAHCLIFTPDEFIKTLNNPFLIFDNFNFLNDAESMVADYDQVEYRERSCKIYIDPYQFNPGGEYWVKEASELIWLAEQASTFRHSKQPLSVYGKSIDIDNFLRAIMQFALPQTRLLCSFCSYTGGSEIPPGLYWCLGAPVAKKESTISISAASYTLPPLKIKRSISSFYTMWLDKLAKLDPDTILKYTIAMQDFTIAVSDQRCTSDEALSPEAVLYIYNYFNKDIRQRIEIVLREVFSQNISQSLVEYLLENERNKKTLLDIAASSQVHSNWLIPRLIEWLLKQKPDFSIFKKNDWKVIQTYAEKASSPILLLWASIFINDEKVRQKTLTEIPNSVYKTALELLFTPIRPLDLLSPPNLSILLEKLQPNLAQMDGKEYVDFVENMIKIDAVDHLNELAEGIQTLDNQSLTRLEKVLKRARLIPQQYLDFVMICRNQLGRPSGIINFIKHPLNKIDN